jgi:hypothetical protein
MNIKQHVLPLKTLTKLTVETVLCQNGFIFGLHGHRPPDQRRSITYLLTSHPLKTCFSSDKGINDLPGQ